MNKTSPLLLIVFFLLGFTVSNAQQDPIIANYKIASTYYNPGVAGTTKNAEAVILYRSHWTGMLSNPNFTFVSIHGPVSYKRVGLGAQLLKASYPDQSYLQFNLQTSYKVRLRNSFLSLGIEAGGRQYNNQFASLKAKDSDDPVAQDQISKLTPDISSGIYWYNEKFTIGFSARHLNAAMANFKGSASEIKLNRYYCLMTGANLNLSRSIEFQPSFLVKYVSTVSSQMDVTTNFSFQHTFNVGLACRSGSGEVGFRAGLDLEVLTGRAVYLGYAFDYGLSRKVQVYQLASHELILRYYIKPRPNAENIRKQKKILSPSLL